MTLTTKDIVILSLSFYGFIVTVLILVAYRNHRDRIRGDYGGIGRIRSVTY